MPFEFNIGRSREQDFQTMCERMSNAGWEVVSDQVTRIKVSVLQWADVSQNGGSLYKKGPNSSNFVDITVASPTYAVLNAVPYAYVPRSPLVFGIINRIEAGNILPVFEYQ